MKPKPCNTSDADDPRFDRLVDGELSEQQRRELLAGLDDEPGGWRRCALAFLESQCWKQTLGSIAREGVWEPAREIATLRRRSLWRGRLGTLLAMAASFLVVFWVGSSVQRMRVGRLIAPAGAIGEVAATAGNRQVAVQPSQPSRALAGALPPQAWRMVTVSAPGGATEAGGSFSLPAVERDNIDKQWMQSLPPAIPEDVVRAFNRTGHQVEQHRELVPVPLQDGRRLVVPVDQVNIHYVGGQGAY